MDASTRQARQEEKGGGLCRVRKKEVKEVEEVKDGKPWTEGQWAAASCRGASLGIPESDMIGLDAAWGFSKPRHS